ncbi:MAG: hypothetical protein ACREBH_02205 [Candidatus Micrarchaeaceae archaeon]
MQDTDSGIPPWLVCEDILNRIKTELITQAMDTLQEAIDSKAIEVNGSLINLPDKPSDTEMSMFIINKLVEQKESIMEMYGSQMPDGAADVSDPNMIMQKERLRKFLLAVEQISMLMDYSKALDSWMHDVAMQADANTAADVIRRTADTGTRAEILQYVLKNRKISNDGLLTGAERSMLEESAA